MYIKKEHYRKFETRKFLYLNAFERPETTEAEKKIPEKKDAEDSAKKDMGPEIEAQKTRVQKQIERAKASIPKDQQGVAESFFNELKNRVENDFNTLNEEYQQAKKEIGTANWEGSEVQKDIHQRAETLADQIIEHHLQDKETIEKTVQDFLEKMPNSEAREEEKELIKNWIQENPELKEYYGESGTSGHLENVVDLVAKKYDIRFDEENRPAYGADLVSKKVYNEIDLKNVIIAELKPTPEYLYSPQKIKETEQKTKEVTKRIDQLKKEINEGSIRALGGEINEWTDWIDHKGVEELAALNGKMEGEIKKVLEQRKELKAQEKRDAKRAEKLSAYYDVVEVANVQEKIDQAIASGYVELWEHEEAPNPAIDRFSGKKVLENPADGSRITIEIDADQRILLTLKSNEPAFESQQSFSNPEDFKTVDLVDDVRADIENYKKNTEFLSKLDLVLNDITIPNLAIEKEAYPTEELTQENFRGKPIRFKMDDMVVGRLFTDYENKSFNIVIPNGTQLKNVNGIHVAENINSLEREMKLTAESSRKRRQELGAYASDLQNIGTLEGLTINFKSPEEIKGDFTDPGEKFLVGEVVRTDGSTAATISVVGNEYLIQNEIGEQQFFFAHEDLKTYLEANRESLAKLPEKNNEFTEPDKAMKEKLRERFGRQLGKIDEDILNPLVNRFLDFLHTDYPNLFEKIKTADGDLNKLELTNEEDTIIEVYFMKSLGYDTSEQEASFKKGDFNIKKISGSINKDIAEKYRLNEEAANKLGEAVNSKEFKASQEKLPKKSGILSLIKAVALVAQMIKNGDYDAAMDAWNHKDNLNDDIDQSKKIYERVIQKADLKTLLAVHTNPQGDEAKTMLPGEFEKTPFRGMLKQVAQERLQKIMGTGVDISKWEKDKVEFTRFGKSYEMHLDPTQGLESFHLREAKEGVEPVPYKIEDGLTGPGRTLENVFGQAVGRVNTSEA